MLSVAHDPLRSGQIWAWKTGAVTLDSKVDDYDPIRGIDFPDLEDTFLVWTTYSIQVWGVSNGSIRLTIPLFLGPEYGWWSSTSSNLAATNTTEGISVFDIITGARVLFLGQEVSRGANSTLMKAGIFFMATDTELHKAFSTLKLWDAEKMSGVRVAADLAYAEGRPKHITGPIVRSIPFK